MKLDTSNIPELSFLSDWMIENKEIYEEIIGTYSEIINMLLSIGTKEIEVILAARESMKYEGVKLHSASELNTGMFIKLLQNIDKTQGEQLGAVFDFENMQSQHARVKLQEMLENGSKIANQNSDAKPIDGDAKWDEVIWGHTQANKDVDKKVLVHFVVSHYICQYMNHTLGLDFLLSQKDDFINVLADMILLGKTQNTEDYEIYDIWSTSKLDGGIGWIDEKQFAVYQNIISNI